VTVALPSTAAATSPAITGTNIVATVGTQFSGLIATSNLAPGDIPVDWGDGTTSGGAIAPDGSITGTHTYTQEGSFDITLTSGSVTGHSTAIVLSTSQGGALTGSNVVTVPSGGSGTASVLPPGAGVTATLQQPSGPATLFVAAYGHNPESVPLVAGGFYDVRVVGGGSSATLKVVFHYTGITGTPQLLFFNTATGSYVAVQSPSIAVDPTAQTITVVLNATTVPSITQLTQTVFAAAAPAATPTVAPPRFTG